MPKVEEYCEVRTENGIFRDWTAVSVRYGIDPSFQRMAQLECAEPMQPGRSGIAKVARRLKNGDRVDVALAGKLVIEGGYIKIRQTAYDANRHAVQVVVMAKSNPIREVSVDIADGGQYRGHTLEAIAKRALAQVGVGFKLINPPAIASMPFRNVIVQTGETIGDLIERLARQRNMWLWTDVDGTVMAGDPSAGGASATLEEGVNIVAASSYIEFPWAENVVMYSQAQGSDDLWGRRASEIGAKSTISSGDSGKTVIGLAEHPATQPELQARTDMEAKAINAAIHRDAITHKGWFRPGSSDLWKEGDSATVKSPMLYPFANGEQNLRVWAVTCSQSNEGGSTTQVELVNEATFQQRFPDATQGSPFATPAVPDSGAT
jgi:prophage tail gpP-like protein